MSMLDSINPFNTERAESSSQFSFAGLLGNAPESFKFSNDNTGSSSALTGFPSLELTDVGRATASIGEIGAVANPANALSFLEGDKRDGGQGSFELTLNPVLPPTRLLGDFDPSTPARNLIRLSDVPGAKAPFDLAESILDRRFGTGDPVNFPGAWEVPRPYVPISGELTGPYLDNKISHGDPVNIPPGIVWDQPIGPLPHPYDPTGQLSGSRVPEEDVSRPGRRPPDVGPEPGDQPQRPGDGQDKPKDPIDKVLDSLSKEDLASLVKHMLAEQAKKELEQQGRKQEQPQQPQNLMENLLQMLRKMFEQPTIVRVPKNRPGGGGDTNRPEEPQPEQPGERPEQPPEQPRITQEQLDAATKAFKYFEQNKERLKGFANGTPPTDQEMKELVKNLDAVKAIGWENQLPSVGVDQKYLEALVTVFGKGTDTSSSDTVLPTRADVPSNPLAPSSEPVFA